MWKDCNKGTGCGKTVISVLDDCGNTVIRVLDAEILRYGYWMWKYCDTGAGCGNTVIRVLDVEIL